MLRENTSIAFVVDRSLRVLLWSNGLVEATNISQDTVEGRDVSSLPFVTEDNRDNTTTAIRHLFLERESGSKRRMVVALAPGARTAFTATREILLQFTAAYFEDYQHVVCVGLRLEGALSSLLQYGQQDASEVSSLTEMSSLTAETPSGINTEMSLEDGSRVASTVSSGHEGAPGDELEALSNRILRWGRVLTPEGGRSRFEIPGENPGRELPGLAGTSQRHLEAGETMEGVPQNYHEARRLLAKVLV